MRIMLAGVPRRTCQGGRYLGGRYLGGCAKARPYIFSRPTLTTSLRMCVRLRAFARLL